MFEKAAKITLPINAPASMSVGKCTPNMTLAKPTQAAQGIKKTAAIGKK